MTTATKLQGILNSKAAIKAAIEAKGVTVGDITLAAYPAKIDEIQQGGGGGGTGDFVVRFWNRGVLLKTEYVDAGEDATPPTPPTYANLTFVEWNNPFINVQGDINADAIYNHTILQINLNDPNWLTPTIYLNKSDTSVLNIYNENTLLATSSDSGNIQLLLTFASVGDYDIRIECAGEYNFGNGTASTACFVVEYVTILRNIYIAADVTTINNNAFYNCHALALTSLPTDVTTISSYAFYNCYALALTSLPAGVTTISNNAFYNCHALALTSLPTDVTTINSNAFQNCYALALTSLPADVTTINVSAFYNCYALALTSLPAGVTTISNNAFYNCYALALTSLPAGVTTISNNAFYNCYALALTSLPTDVTTISNNAFRDAKRMITITFAPNTISIGDYAFSGCTNILSYTIDQETPPTLVNIRAFTDINPSCKIYVPASAVDTYKAATNWITYAAYIFAIPT